ncbi:hypothetical protein [Acinetobacter sp. NIPH 1852]|nr:hypothetical protein [Acinetobacter sp. NIPH 1852]
MAPFCTANRATSYSSVQALAGHFLVTAKSKFVMSPAQTIRL